MGTFSHLKTCVHPNHKPVTLPPTVCIKFLEDALGQKLPRRRPQSGPGEQLTVFQFWSYVEALDSPSMEAYVTETAEEGEPVALIIKWVEGWRDSSFGKACALPCMQLKFKPRQEKPQCCGIFSSLSLSLT